MNHCGSLLLLHSAFMALSQVAEAYWEGGRVVMTLAAPPTPQASVAVAVMSVADRGTHKDTLPEAEHQRRASDGLVWRRGPGVGVSVRKAQAWGVRKIWTPQSK